MSLVYVSSRVVFGQAFVNTILNALGTNPAAALIVAAKCRLSQLNGFNPVPGSTIASLAANEATFTGYTAGGNAYTPGVGQNLTPNAQGAVTSVVFTATGSTTTNNIYGYWLDNGTNFIMGEAFPVGTVASFQAAGDFLEIVVEFPVQLRQATF